MQSAATNHGFIEGNKRTSGLLVDLLLDRSGYRLVPDDGEDLNQAIEDPVVECVVRDHWPVVRIARSFAARIARKE